MCQVEGFDVLEGAYFLSATLSTVGYGDYALSQQRTRAAAVFLIPLGLVVLTLLVRARPLTLPRATSLCHC